MDNVALVADVIDHHPEWTNYESEVCVNLSTHDVDNKVSMKDFILAKAMVKWNRNGGDNKCVIYLYIALL